MGILARVLGNTIVFGLCVIGTKEVIKTVYVYRKAYKESLVREIATK